MRFETLDDWLRWQESLSPVEIDLGLERVAEVLTRLGLDSRFPCPLITVAGTNGKGSVVAFIESMAAAAGLRVASYTSPHLYRYNERIRFDRQPVGDAQLCHAFAAIDEARGDIALTYFEFGTLAAIWLCFQQPPDLVVLEVGLGGRLDAVNIMDADVAVLTSVAIDHCDWLGADREAIGREKAGVFRPGQTVICGDAEPPQSVLDRAAQLPGLRFWQAGKDFECIVDTDGRWQLDSRQDNTGKSWRALPVPALAGDFQLCNAACAVLSLADVMPSVRPERPELDSGTLAQGLQQARLPGRYQRLAGGPGMPDVFVDVAHNPQAAEALAGILAADRASYSRTVAVCAMLADKEVETVLSCLSELADAWVFAGLPGVARGLDAAAMAARLPAALLQDRAGRVTGHRPTNPCKILSRHVSLCDDIASACECLLQGGTAAGRLDEHCRVIIFGSFHTVSQAGQYFSGRDVPAISQHG